MPRSSVFERAAELVRKKREFLGLAQAPWLASLMTTRVSNVHFLRQLAEARRYFIGLERHGTFQAAQIRMVAETERAAVSGEETVSKRARVSL